MGGGGPGLLNKLRTGWGGQIVGGLLGGGGGGGQNVGGLLGGGEGNLPLLGGGGGNIPFAPTPHPPIIHPHFSSISM